MKNDVLQINMKATGERLKKLCEENCVTIKRIQEELQIGAYKSIYNWFAGKTLPSLDNMYRLSRLLGVPMEDMIVEVCYSIKNKETSLFFLKVLILMPKRHILFLDNDTLSSGEFLP